MSTTTTPESVRIVQSRALSYRLPQSRASRAGHMNRAVVLRAEDTSGTEYEGLGEGQARSWVTGDNSGNSWEFITEAVRRLEQRTLPVRDLSQGVKAVREIMDDLFTLAIERRAAEHYKNPFRGSLLAVETALLDLLAKAAGISLGELLVAAFEDSEPGSSAPAGSSSGSVVALQEQVNEIAGPLSGAETPSDIHEAAAQPLSWEEDFPAAQTDDLHTALMIVEIAVQKHSTASGDSAQRMGIDLGAALERDAASAFLRRVVSLATQGKLPKRLVIERPVARNYRWHVKVLQDEAARLLDASGRKDVKVEILDPRAHWDHDTPSQLLGARRPASVQVVRPSQHGSLLRSVERVLEITTARTDATVILADLPGSTGLGRAALRELSRVLPGLEAAILDVADMDEPIGYETLGAGGHGMSLAYETLVSDVREMVTFPPLETPTYEGRPVAVYNDVDHLHPLGPNGSKGHLLERQALALGLTTTRYSKGAFYASDGEHPPLIFKWSRNPLSSAASLALCTHKEGTRMQLQRAGVPVPQGRTFANGDFETAKQFVDRIGYPVVVKPAMGVRGIGVVAGIQNEQELDAAFDIMRSSKLGKQDFIVEKHINGRDYRIVVVGDKVIAAIQREPASVFGDGKSTIAELLLNKNIARKRNPHLWARPAKYDEAAKHELQKAGMTLRSVPAPGERVLLANTCSLSQGGDSIDVLDELHPSILEACVKAVNAVPAMEYCGVDFLLEDHTKPLDEQDAGICELNAHAAIGNCEYPMFGKGKPVAETMMRACVDHYGLNVPDKPADEVSLQLTIRGRVNGVGFDRWLKQRAEVSGVTGWVRTVDRKTVEAVIAGPTVAATAVASATILGPARAKPTSYVARHIPNPGLTSFEIREDTSDRLRRLTRKVRTRAGYAARRMNLHKVKNTVMNSPKSLLRRS